MHWTTDKPTKPGWYLYFDRYTCAVEVGYRQQLMEPYNGMWVWFTGGRQSKLHDLNGEWAGPIPEPTEHKEG